MRTSFLIISYKKLFFMKSFFEKAVKGDDNARIFSEKEEDTIHTNEV